MEKILQLTPEEKAIIDSTYGRQSEGYNPRNLEAILELNAHEEKFFAGKNFVPSHFLKQTLYKISGTVSPIKFTSAVYQTFEENLNLRANFCNVGTRTLKVIKPVAAVTLDITFRNMTQINPDEYNSEFDKIFEVDTFRGISLKNDPLIRFAVYKMSAADFGVLVTIAQVVADSFDAKKFFAKLFDMAGELEQKEIAAELPPKNSEVIRRYWEKLFDNAPPLSVLPYERKIDGEETYRHHAFRTELPADIFSDLRGLAQSNQMLLMAILQTAWGFMLHMTNERADCLFCQISSAKDSSLSVIPIRITAEVDLTVEQIVRRQFKQAIVSQPYSLSDWSVLDELTVHKKLFNHFVSFRGFSSSDINFVGYAKTPAAPLGNIVYQTSWNVQDMELGLNLHYLEKKLLVIFTYAPEKFSGNAVEKIFKLYLLILKQMIVDWNAKLSDCAERLFKRTEIQEDAAEIFSHKDNVKKLRDFISQVPVLQGDYKGTIDLFVNNAEFVTLYEGDRLSGEMLAEKFFFVADGLLSRNVDIGDGWYNTLDIIEKNGFINPTNLLDKQRYKLSATVLTDQAELLAIPHNTFIEILRKEPEVALSVIRFALRQMERLQMLWIQS